MRTGSPVIFTLLFFTASVFSSYMLLLILLRSSIIKFFCDKPDARKVHSKPIPRLGGISIVLTFFSITASFLLLNNVFDLSIPISRNLNWALFLSAIIIFISGVFDDSTFITVRVRHKITAELIIALSSVYLFNIHFGQITLFGSVLIPLWFCKLISVLWVLGLINAFNMIDGIDGLAGGVSLISIMTLAVIAYLGGLLSVFIICFILAGSTIGFLRFNLPPAKAFMGDTGSLFLGTMIAVISMQLGNEVVQSRTIFVIPLIAGIPIIEVLVTMVRRYFKAKDSGYSQFERIHSMVVPDNSHIHHRLTFLGFSHFETTAVLCVFSFTLCCGAICLFLVPIYAVYPILCYLTIPVIFALDRLGFGGRFKKALHLSTTRYNGFKKRSLIGVIDFEGTTLHLLKNGTNDEIKYVSITEEELPGISKYLKAVVLKKNDANTKKYIDYAEQVSVMIGGPIFIVSPESSSSLSILEVYRNGSLKVDEKKASITELIKDMEKVPFFDKIKTKGESHSICVTESKHQ